MRSVLALGLAAVASAAMADPPAPPPPAVNLLAAVPTVVAVSSTVENPSILPSHLVDGKLDTAWNSRTGDLVGAWFAVRLPADVHVDAIKLTAGFTKVDKKWGDLFTMNPRIKRVRVTHDGTLVGEKALDPELRTLQSIAIGKGGGSYTVEILEVVPGTRKDWQEVNISELEVWGTLGKSMHAAKVMPVVHIGGFEHDDLTRAQCLAALFDKPRSIKVTSFATFDLDDDRAVCRIDQPGDPQPTETIDHDTPTTRVTVGVVKRGAKLVRIAKLPDFTAATPEREQQMGMPPQLLKTIALGTVQLTTSEVALSVTDTEAELSMSYSKDNVTFQLFRIGASSATSIFQFNSSTAGSTNGGDSHRCTFVVPQVTDQLPAELEVNCTDKHEAYPGDPDHKDRDTEGSHTDRYKWTGKLYDLVEAPK